MDRLWAWHHPVAVLEVAEDLQCDRTWVYTTVMAVMDNWHRKGVLAREKNGRAYAYRPTRTREQYTAAFMRDVLAGTADTTVTLRHFLEQMPSAEVASLRTALDEHQRNGRGTALRSRGLC